MLARKTMGPAPSHASTYHETMARMPSSTRRHFKAHASLNCAADPTQRCAAARKASYTLLARCFVAAVSVHM